jgi:multiple sugar transport system substrate-binding protein
VRVNKRASHSPRFSAPLPTYYVIAFLCMLLLLSGCGKVSDTASGGITTLKFWNGFTGPDGKTMEAMVRQFEKENPDIRVNMQIIPWAQYYDKLTLGLAFHQAPDIFVCHANRMPEFARYNVFKDLGEFQKGAQALPENDFLPLPWLVAHFDGKQYGVPLDCHPLGLYYNRKLFKEAGVVDAKGEPKPPATWPEFLDAAHKLTKDTDGDGRPDQWGFAFTWQHSNWYLFAFQHGADALSPDLKRSALDTPAALEATEQMRRMITMERIAPQPEGIDAWTGFRQGRVAMAMEGIYMLADLEKTKGLDYGAAPVPAFGPVKATWAGSHLLCIPAQSSASHSAAAWRLIKYLSDHSLDWAQGGQVPVRKSLLESARFKGMRVQSAFAQQLPYVHYEPFSTRATEIQPLLDDAIESAILGLQPPKEALNEANTSINHVLSRP